METEVYVLCKNCNEITDGIGSGDFRDLIECKKCGNKHITATKAGYFKSLKDEKEKPLYIEEGFVNNPV